MTNALVMAKNLEAHHIRMARSGLDITVRELAVLSNVNKATIVRIEAGYPVRETTQSVIRKTLEEKGAKFLQCKTTKEIYVHINTDNTDVI